MTGRPRVDAEIRFWNNVRKTKSCWLFGNKRLPGNYVLFRVTPEKQEYAHRYSYKRFKGKIPRRLLVCHSCDVRNCIRPSHLWVGTQKENLADMKAKGRSPDRSGSKNGMFGRRSRGFSGRKHSAASIRRMVLVHTGVKHTEETKAKMRKARRRRS